MVSAHQTFLSSIRSADPVALFEPLSQLCHGNRTLAHAVWIDLFPQIWQQFSSEVRKHGVHGFCVACGRTRARTLTANAVGGGARAT